MSPNENREMQEWASSNGAVFRQRNGSQETTMARSGTLSENSYYQELKPICDSDNSDKLESESNIPKYDSDEASTQSEENDNGESLN